MNKNIIIAVFSLAVAGGGVIWWMERDNPSQTVGSAEQDAGSTPDDPDSAVDTSSIVEMTMGDENAPVTIIEYASYTCPHCASFHADQFKKLKTEFIDTGEVHFIYREVYFDGAGIWASIVARCAGPERFFGVSDLIYAEQREWLGSGQDPVAIADNLRRIGKVAGIDEAQLQACLSDETKAQTLVAWYQKNAAAHDVTSTPTLIINGEKHGNMSYSALKEIVEGLISG
ncbi:MAG: DsbA family protein [Pseudomonadota bacterium]